MEAKDTARLRTAAEKMVDHCRENPKHVSVGDDDGMGCATCGLRVESDAGAGWRGELAAGGGR